MGPKHSNIGKDIGDAGGETKDMVMRGHLGEVPYHDKVGCLGKYDQNSVP